MRTFLRLLGFIKPHLGEVSVSVLLGVATISAGIGLLGTSAFLIASAALHPSIAELQVAIVGVRFFGISRAAFRYGERLVSHSINLRLVSSLRSWFYRQVTLLKQDDASVYRAGDLLDRVLKDLETLENFYVRVLSPYIVFSVVTAGTCLFIGRYDAWLGAILAAGLLITGLVLPIVSIILTRKSANESARRNSDLSASLVESLAGLEELQAFGTNREVIKQVIELNHKVNQAQMKTVTLGGVNNGMVLLAMNLTILGLIWFAAPLIQEQALSGVSLAVIVMIGMASFEAANTLPIAAQRLTESVASAAKLFSIAGQGSDQDMPNLPPVPGGADRLTLKDISFHRTDNPDFYLDRVSLDLLKGKKIALVGPSGGGKSSLVDLILKFYQPDAGSIQLNGQDTRNLDTTSLRDQFGVLSQEGYLFNCSLRDNLLLAKPGASDEEILNVLSRVGLTPWVETLPNRLDTWLGERGINISGGELQRVRIARLILQDRPFLLLDEPMVNLDRRIVEELTEMLLVEFSQKGILWITHDLSSLGKMDEILYLEGGRILERGSHAALLARNGRFAKLFNLQIK